MNSNPICSMTMLGSTPSSKQQSISADTVVVSRSNSSLESCCSSYDTIMDDTNDHNNDRISSQRFGMMSADAAHSPPVTVADTVVTVSDVVDYSNCMMLSAMQRQFQQQQRQLRLQRITSDCTSTKSSSLSYSCPNTPQLQYLSKVDTSKRTQDDWNKSVSVLPFHQQSLQSLQSHQKLVSIRSSSSMTLARKRMKQIQKHKIAMKRRRNHIICWNRLPTMYEVQEEMTNHSSSNSTSHYDDDTDTFESSIMESPMTRMMRLKITSPSALAMPMLLASAASSSSSCMTSFDGTTTGCNSIGGFGMSVPSSPSYINRRFRRSSIRKDMSPRQPKRKSSLTLSYDDAEIVSMLEDKKNIKNQQSSSLIDTPAKQPERKLSISLLTEPFEQNLRIDQSSIPQTPTSPSTISAAKPVAKMA
jgi:hypothetical protein